MADPKSTAIEPVPEESDKGGRSWLRYLIIGLSVFGAVILIAFGAWTVRIARDPPTVNIGLTSVAGGVIMLGVVALVFTIRCLRLG